MYKKGQGISINVIIIAAIALLVLVVLSVLVLRSTSNTVEGTSCEGLGGTCDTSCDGALTIENRAGNCLSDNDVCCVSLTRDNS